MAMQITRRQITLSSLAFMLSACMPGGGPTSRSAGSSTTFRAVPNAGYDAWVASFRARADARGITPGILHAAFRDAGFLPDVIDRDRNQTEFSRTLEDYLAIAGSDERVTLGRAMYRQYSGALNAIENRYGVEPHVVAAVWGLESFFGTRRGDVPVISALSTLAYEGRREQFFESQLMAALRILQNGDIPADRMTGSWAGAMGHTQFIPTSYLAYAVDFTGDGRRDIWSDDPTDALASTANYLAKSGWTRNLPWGAEVRLPPDFDAKLLGRGKGKSAAAWAGMGVRAVSGNLAAGSIIAPAGLSGPAFLLTSNFNVILRYNNAENYALGIGTLADRLNGGGPLSAGFGPDATGMTIADRQDLQRRLTAAGFDTQGSDGVIGAKTRAAISAYQASVGLPVDGEPSLEILRRLR
jgi:membrane-bound lytic murein transglycosylase B